VAPLDVALTATGQAVHKADTRRGASEVERAAICPLKASNMVI